jgi:hypothetical protein
MNCALAGAWMQHGRPLNRVVRRHSQGASVISNIDAARKVVTLLLDASGAIDQSVAEVKDHGTADELKAYAQVAGGILGQILTEALNPLFREHPELVPAQLSQWYPTNDA